ncbi:hypothetical protein CL176_03800 [Suicoccus acidiformans]|uniref:Uncharacterized protein n=1 Tax=Suicoccus acidiformans TaxID=2036206 RepID=A0A347WJG8_9LACT|nr:YlbG family protein [Suicoccus acidiformans]AXY25225.1 hypothetical protein CL176_03800 [Suicoccus acidiformans]
MEMVKREGLIIWMKSFKYINNLRKYGYIHYASKKMKYAVLYVDQELAEETIQQLTYYSFIDKIERSYRDDIDMTFPSVGPGPMKDVTPEDEEGESAFFSQIAREIQAQTKERGQ